MLNRSFYRLLDPQAGENWLDAGCDPLGISELIYKKSGCQIRTIEAIDVVLAPVKEKIRTLSQKGYKVPMNLKYASLTDPLPYPENCFDGIGANFVLPDVHDFMGNRGRYALKKVISEMSRVLKPGGRLVWSTLKKGAISHVYSSLQYQICSMFMSI